MIFHRRRNQGKGGGPGSPPPPPPRDFINIHACSADRRNRSVYYIQPPQNGIASYAYVFCSKISSRGSLFIKKLVPGGGGGGGGGGNQFWGVHFYHDISYTLLNPHTVLNTHSPHTHLCSSSHHNPLPPTPTQHTSSLTRLL